MIRPSALPMLSQCPAFSGDSGEFAEAGTKRHKAFARLLSSNDPLALQDLPEEEQESVEWAVDYVRLKAPMQDHPLFVECKINPLKEDFEPYFEHGGTLDVCCGRELFDLKWRERDYDAQMAAYALGMMQYSGWDRVRVHLLFGATKRARVFEFTEQEANAIVQRVIAGAGGPPKPCDYCGWCSKRLICSAHLERVNAVVAGREDWKLDQYHSSQIETAEEMGKALRLARQLSKWCDAVDFAAKEMAQKKGIVPTGFKLAKSGGKTYCADVPRAFQLAGVPQEDFLAACDLRINTSKKYPDRKGLSEFYGKQTGIAKTRAAKELKSKLAEVLKRGADGIKLVADNSTDSEEEE